MHKALRDVPLGHSQEGPVNGWVTRETTSEPDFLIQHPINILRTAAALMTLPSSALQSLNPAPGDLVEWGFYQSWGVFYICACKSEGKGILM